MSAAPTASPLAESISPPAPAETVRRCAQRVADDVRTIVAHLGSGAPTFEAYVDAAHDLCSRRGDDARAIDELIAAIEAAAGGRTEESRVWRVRRDHLRCVDPKAGWRAMKREWLPDLRRLIEAPAAPAHLSPAASILERMALASDVSAKLTEPTTLAAIDLALRTTARGLVSLLEAEDDFAERHLVKWVVDRIAAHVRSGADLLGPEPAGEYEHSAWLALGAAVDGAVPPVLAPPDDER